MDPAKEDMARLVESAEKLSEHFDTVQIFVTRHGTGNSSEAPDEVTTMNAAWGAGNWFARYGQVDEWLVKQMERTKMQIRGED